MSTLNLENIKHPDSASNNVSVASDGRVGIGTANPNAPLEIVDSVNDAKLKVTTTGTSRASLIDLTGTIAGYNWIQSDTNGTSDWRIGGGATTSTLTFATGASYTERMRIDSAGRVTMPYQPAFFARGISNSVSGGGRDYDDPADWDDVYVNVGSSFNASNGRFTAPVDGVYRLSAEQFCVNSVTGTYQGIQIKRNGNNYGHTMYGYVQTQADETVSTSVIMTMSAGDYAIVRCAVGGGGTQDGNRIHFSGQLIG